MEKQESMPLFAYRGGPGFQKHSRTSRKAAEDGAPSFSRQAGIVLEYISSQGRTGAITDEIRRALLAEKKIHENSVMSARVRELEMAGMIVKTTEERRTSANQPANVYVTAEIFNLGGFLRDCAKPATENKKPAAPAQHQTVLFFDYIHQNGMKYRYKATPITVFWGGDGGGEWVMQAINHATDTVKTFAVSKMTPVK